MKFQNLTLQNQVKYREIEMKETKQSYEDDFK
jgi:hypothetical protein